MKWCIVFFLLTFLCPASWTARILGLLPFPSKSHYMIIQPIFEELANRGHEITLITSYFEKNPKYTQIIVDRRSFWESLGGEPDLYSLEALDLKQTLDLAWNGAFFTTEAAFNSSTLKEFIKNDRSHFDLIITEIFYQESMYMFKHKYDAPMVGICTLGFTQFIAETMGNPLVLAYQPHEFLNLGKHFSFSERLTNTFDTLYDLAMRRYYFLPRQQALAEKSFTDLPRPLPDLRDIERNFSAILISTHFSYDVVRPYVPGIVEIGGVHIKKTKPLAKNIQKFLDEAINGAVYFSFGSNVLSKDMPEDKLKVLLNVFRNSKLKFLWKWEDESLADKPDNVMISKWLPQNDILAHPNIKLFITHGGLLSLQEAIHHGVPLLGFPFYGDQHLNLKKAVDMGFAIDMKFMELDERSLEDTIDRLVNDSKYKQTVKQLSSTFRDRPMSAMDTSIYWIEYVIRHKGAPFLRSPILDLPVLVYHQMDIVLFVAACVFGVVLFVCLVCAVLISKLSAKKKLKKH